MKRNLRPEVNAGSMADIAFLLLIFFLVTAMIPNEEGINRKLPRECLTNDCKPEINQRNILSILVNRNNEIMVNNERVTIDAVTDRAKNFIDNNGDLSCLYCNGLQDKSSSDNPTKAVISLQTDRDTDYKTFVAVQNALTKAYFQLRVTYAKKKFKKPIDELDNKQLSEIKKAYPFIISEAEIR